LINGDLLKSSRLDLFLLDKEYKGKEVERMPDFSEPFAGLAKDRKLTDQD
jgi:hypothetical protein